MQYTARLSHAQNDVRAGPVVRVRQVIEEFVVGTIRSVHFRE